VKLREELEVAYMTEQSADKQNEAGLTKFQKIDIRLKIVGTVLALATLAIFYCQFRGLRDQTKAIWYSNRPALRIHPIEAEKDIRPYTGVVKSPVGSFSDSTLFSLLTFTIENEGNSPALIDTIYYELARQNTLMSDTVSYCVLPLSPKDVVAETMKLLLRKDRRSIFAITIVYDWEKPVATNEKFRLDKYFIAYHAEDCWHVNILSSEQYRAEKEEFCPGKKL